MGLFILNSNDVHDKDICLIMWIQIQIAIVWKIVFISIAGSKEKIQNHYQWCEQLHKYIGKKEIATKIKNT